MRNPTILQLLDIAGPGAVYEHKILFKTTETLADMDVLVTSRYVKRTTMQAEGKKERPAVAISKSGRTELQKRLDAAQVIAMTPTTEQLRRAELVEKVKAGILTEVEKDEALDMLLKNLLG